MIVQSIAGKIRPSCLSMLYEGNSELLLTFAPFRLVEESMNIRMRLLTTSKRPKQTRFYIDQPNEKAKSHEISEEKKQVPRSVRFFVEGNHPTKANPEPLAKLKSTKELNSSRSILLRMKSTQTLHCA